ncbi:MAG: hypothetical protein Q4E63_01470 [Prevotellaceae bacterium]|nr:hypothetical protein [Prevotellaceae bacterium]MDO4931311.1 hypothetical protein [Prevotellaceae bacterium]
MRKRLFQFAILVIGMLVALPMTADAAKKEKKEKKPYEWTWNGEKSGNADIDAYLIGVDTLWRNMKVLHEQWEMYQYKEDTIAVNGKYYIIAHMEDSEGKYVTRGTVNWQLAHTITESVGIVGNSTVIALQTATATLSLPQLGLKGLSYAKYVKGGPNVIALSAKEMKAIWKIAVQQAKRWNEMKKDAKDPESIGYNVSENMKKVFDKCCYIKEVTETDPQYQVVKEVMSAKTEEQIKQESEAVFAKMETTVVLSEDKSKSLDQLDDAGLDEFNKEMS